MEHLDSKIEEGDKVAKTFRLFVAITLPDAVKDRIEEAQRKLKQANLNHGIRWTKREQFHLTLKFLGNVEAARLQGLRDALCEACKSFAPVSLHAKEIGFFPDARRPRVIWAGVNDPGNILARLQENVEAAVKAFTNEKPEKAFAGHVTLGRIQRIKPPEAESLARLARSMAGFAFGEWAADRLELIRSELSSSGSRYTTISAVPFSS